MKFLIKIIENYYWAFFLISILSFLHFRDLGFLLTITIVFCSLYCFRNIEKYVIVDYFVCFYLFYTLISCLFSNYNFELYFYGIKYQVVYTLLYFVGRSHLVTREGLYGNFEKPLLIAFFIGLVLYVWQPAWYIAPKLENLSEYATEASYHEMTRLSSIWPHSYFVGYSSAFYIMYVFKKYLIDREYDKYFMIKLSIATLCLFFAQQRVSITFSCIYILGLSLYSLRLGKEGWKIIKIIIAITLIGAGILYYLNNYAENSLLTYIVERSSSSDEGNFITDRIHMFDHFSKYVNLIGCGLGRFGHQSMKYYPDFIGDNEYMRILCELGYIGLFLILTIFLISIKRGLHAISYFSFELGVAFFFLFAMIGAAPLELGTLQPYLLWFCLGRLNTPSKTLQKLNIS